MADNKKYYYLKIKENFFDSDGIIILESMPDGFLYSNILLKLYLRSLKGDGRLMFNERIPYNATVLAQLTRHTVGTVEKALKIFEQLGLIEILDNGAIFILDIQNYIGESSTEADRKREYRAKIENEKAHKISIGQMSEECPDKNPPELEIDLEKKKDLELEKEIDINAKKSKPKKSTYGEYSNVKLTQEEFDRLVNDEGMDIVLKAIKILDEYIETKHPKYYNHNLVLRKWPLEQAKGNNKQYGKPKEETDPIKQFAAMHGITM